MSLRKRLLHEDDLSFERAIRIAKQYETAKSQSRMLSNALKLYRINTVQENRNSNTKNTRRFTKSNDNTSHYVVQ